MKNVRNKLIEIAIQNKKGDIKDNRPYWDGVISDLKKAQEDLDLLEEIARFDFGFDSLDEVMGEQNPNNNTITNQRDLLIAFMRYVNDDENLKYSSVGIERKVDNFLNLTN